MRISHSKHARETILGVPQRQQAKMEHVRSANALLNVPIPRLPSRQHRKVISRLLKGNSFDPQLFQHRVDIGRILHLAHLRQHQPQYLKTYITITGVLSGCKRRLLLPQLLNQILLGTWPPTRAEPITRRQAFLRLRRQPKGLWISKIVDQITLKDIAWDAAELAAQRPQRDVLPGKGTSLLLRQLGEILADGVVEMQRPLGMLLQYPQHGEDFRAAGDAVGAATVDCDSTWASRGANAGGMIVGEKRALRGGYLKGEGGGGVII